MEKFALAFPDTDRLKTLVCLDKSQQRTHEVGTAYLPSGCRMPDVGVSAHPRHEVSIILEGLIETTSEGRTCRLGAGDIVSIPAGDRQSTEVLEDTRLIYIFFDD